MDSTDNEKQPSLVFLGILKEFLTNVKKYNPRIEADDSTQSELLKVLLLNLCNDSHCIDYIITKVNM